MIARNITASVVQVVVSGVIMFVLYRRILDILGTEQLGIWSVVLATASASRIGELGLSAGVTRFVARYRALERDEASGRAMQTAALSIAGLFALVLSAAYPLLSLLFVRLFPAGALGAAHALLPYALVSLWLGAVAGVFQSGLDGCQRIDWRVLLTVFGQVLFFSAALWLVPRYGLMGLAWAQILQGTVALITGWLALRRLLPGLPWFPYEWRWVFFREMMCYGLQFQLGSIAMMLFDPLTKGLLGKYGGLAAAGYYEMASQLVNKVRTLIIAANQVLVPVIAGLNETEPGRLRELYRANLHLLFYVTFPIYALVAAWGPILSELWLGRYERVFAFFVSVLALAWCINTFAGPAYFANLGTGHIFWNTASQIWMGLTNAALGVLLGPYFGASGIVWGMAIALATGSALIMGVFQSKQRLSWSVLVPRESVGSIAASVALVVSGFFAYHALSEQPAVIRFLVCLLLPVPILGPALWGHALRLIGPKRSVYDSLFP